MIGHMPNKNTHHNTISMPVERIHNLSLWVSSLEWCLIRLSLMTQGRQEISSTERVHLLTRKVCETTFRETMISYLTIHLPLFVYQCLRAVVCKLTNPVLAIYQEMEVWCKHDLKDTLLRITVRMRMNMNISKHQLGHCLSNNHHQKDRLRHRSKSYGPRII